MNAILYPIKPTDAFIRVTGNNTKKSTSKNAALASPPSPPTLLGTSAKTDSQYTDSIKAKDRVHVG